MGERSVHIFSKNSTNPTNISQFYIFFVAVEIHPCINVRFGVLVYTVDYASHIMSCSGMQVISPDSIYSFLYLFYLAYVGGWSREAVYSFKVIRWTKLYLIKAL